MDSSDTAHTAGRAGIASASSDSGAALAGKRFAWLEWLALLAGQALFFQAFPASWTRLESGFSYAAKTILSAIDVRTWSLAGYMIAMTAILIFLVGMKVWKDRIEWDAEVKRWRSVRRKG